MEKTRVTHHTVKHFDKQLKVNSIIDGIHVEFWHDGYIQLYYKWEQAPTSGRLIEIDDLEAEIRRTTDEHTAFGINRTQTAKILKLRKAPQTLTIFP